MGFSMSDNLYKKAQEYFKDYFPQCCSIKDEKLIFVGMEYSKDAEGGCVAFYSPKVKGVWGGIL